jgi:hypothetical protein
LGDECIQAERNRNLLQVLHLQCDVRPGSGKGSLP